MTVTLILGIAGWASGIGFAIALCVIAARGDRDAEARLTQARGWRNRDDR